MKSTVSQNDIFGHVFVEVSRVLGMYFLY